MTTTKKFTRTVFGRREVKIIGSNGHDTGNFLFEMRADGLWVRKKRGRKAAAHHVSFLQVLDLANGQLGFKL